MDIALRRGALDLQALLVLVVSAAIATALVVGAAALLDGAVESVALIALAILWLFHAVLYVVTWRQVRKVAHPLGLHGDGVHGRSSFGEVVVPWPAVASAEIERAPLGRLLRIRLAPAGDPSRDQVTSTVPARLMTALDKRGMRLRLRVLDVDLEALRQAFVVQSAGRVQLR